MNKTIINTARRLLLWGTLCVCAACTNDGGVDGSLDLRDNEIILSDEAGDIDVEVTSNTEWRIDYEEQDWFTTDLRGGQASTTSFKVTFEQNEMNSLRFCDIAIWTSDGNARSTIRLVQLSKHPYITLGTSELEVRSKAADYELAVETNVPETEIVVEPSETWLEKPQLNDGKLYFRTVQSDSNAPRTGTIRLSYKDEYDRETSATVTVTQMAMNESDKAERVDFSTIKSLPAGTIERNIYIEGHIVADGQSPNFPALRYVIQNDAGEAVVFESKKLISFKRFDRVSLWLKGGLVEEYAEGGFVYRAVTGLTAAHIIDQNEDPSFAIPEKYIDELTPDMCFSMVTLKEVEIASPHGAFTNFKTTDPSFSFYYPDYYPDYYRFYPTCIRDVRGGHTYLLTALGVDYAHETLPQGSGSITGIIVREKQTNFNMSEDQLCIRAMERSDIALQQSRNDGFTEVLVEWDCARPASVVDATTVIPTLPPTAGSQPDAILNRTGMKGFRLAYTTTELGFQDDFRGDTGLTLAPTHSNYGRHLSGGLNSQAWTLDAYWYVDKVSTKGIHTLLSLQIETNRSKDIGPGTPMVVQYAFSLEGPWYDIENGSFENLPQFDRGDPNNASYSRFQTEAHIPGYKVYDFKLPADLCDKENICIRLLPDPQKKQMPARERLANLSIKYNK